MAGLWLIAAVHWMLLHGPAGQLYWVNMDQITTMRAPIPSDLRDSFSRGTQCVIVTVNGKFLAVTETCEQVYQLVARAR